MTSPLELSLINGPIPAMITAGGAIALLFLAVAKRRTWWTRVLPIVVPACALLTAAAWFFVNRVWRPFPEPLPFVVLAWLGVAVLGIALAVARWRHSRWPVRVVSVLAAVLVLTSGLSGVNQFFGQYATVRAALGPFLGGTTDLDDAAKPAADEVRVPPGGKLADVWRPPADLPEKGTVSEAPIPSSTNFKPRNAWIYLPPAYAATPRPRLPVLVLLAGQPGTPRDWFDAGQLTQHFDAFAKQHNGLAPIVIAVDQLGSMMANPICVDSHLGQVETYLAKDVPAWVKNRLQVDENRSAWTIAGLSQGGTCSLQLAVRAPEVYANFIDIAGQREPTLSTTAETIKVVFHGDAAAYRRINPLDVLATQRFPTTAGVIVAGASDPHYRKEDREVYEACRRAGMDVQWTELPGAHDWNVWRPGLHDSLPWLARRTGLSN
ncbi:esterase [Lentzea tibetensis]|uniref:Esterase n=1 Tax=Lentzea tibetensis TaxID=2591470 RepID=A0A563EF42_9PSEU|nr:alpha/beta hydrolase-fold protein [Lentzea tibetensis]TWP43977.1 esterase [Lentzea tibetensis]